MFHWEYAHRDMRYSVYVHQQVEALVTITRPRHIGLYVDNCLGQCWLHYPVHTSTNICVYVYVYIYFCLCMCNYVCACVYIYLCVYV